MPAVCPSICKKPKPIRAAIWCWRVATPTPQCCKRRWILLDNEDYSLIIVADCCASPRQRDHDAALDRLAAQGAELVTLDMLALEWLADSDSRKAPEVMALLAKLA